MDLDLTRVVDCEVEGIDFSDYPDFCDAYISNAYYEEEDGSVRQLTEEELDDLNWEHSDFVYETVWDSIH